MKKILLAVIIFIWAFSITISALATPIAGVFVMAIFYIIPLIIMYTSEVKNTPDDL